MKKKQASHWDLVELGGSSESSGSAAYDGHLLACEILRRFRYHVAMTPGVVNDGVLDVLDGHGWLVNA